MEGYNIKPCPFCGSKEAPRIQSHKLSFETEKSSVWVFCWLSYGGCGASGPSKDSEELAICAWNGRELNNNDRVVDIVLLLDQIKAMKPTNINLQEALIAMGEVVQKIIIDLNK